MASSPTSHFRSYQTVKYTLSLSPDIFDLMVKIHFFILTIYSISQENKFCFRPEYTLVPRSSVEIGIGINCCCCCCVLEGTMSCGCR